MGFLSNSSGFSDMLKKLLLLPLLLSFLLTFSLSEVIFEERFEGELFSLIRFGCWENMEDFGMFLFYGGGQSVNWHSMLFFLAVSYEPCFSSGVFSGSKQGLKGCYLWKIGDSVVSVRFFSVLRFRSAFFFSLFSSGLKK